MDYYLDRVEPLVRLSPLVVAVVRLGSLQDVALEELCMPFQLVVLETSTDLNKDKHTVFFYTITASIFV